MIAMLSGRVVDFRQDAAVIDVKGVGYLVQMPTTALESLVLDLEVRLHISTVVREDAITLFGFTSNAEREGFETLRSVNKVGPKLALGILSHCSIDEIGDAVQAGDYVRLSRIPGIGKKTAERLCLELKNKLNIVPASSGGTGTTSKGLSPDPLQLALAQLDYRKSEIDLALNAKEVPGREEASIEERIRAALRLLARPR